jgi:hypothetical protein
MMPSMDFMKKLTGVEVRKKEFPDTMRHPSFAQTQRTIRAGQSQMDGGK